MARAELPPEFTAADRKRLHAVCRALGTSYADFMHFATMQSVTECEGYAQDQELINRYYRGEM